MLKHRIIPALLWKETGLVKGKQFNADRRIGPPIPAVQVYERRNVDELIFLDVEATTMQRMEGVPALGRPPDFELIEEIADNCSMPLTVGGGIRRIGHISKILRHGADKVLVTTKAVRDPSFVTKAAEKFGSQCIVVGIDVKECELTDNVNGEKVKVRRQVVTHRNGNGKTDCDPVVYAKAIEKMGAGEILLQRVERDGMMEGYDLELIERVSNSVRIPVIAMGGAGRPEHFAEALDAGAHATAAASIFQFTSTTPADVTAYLHERGYAMRLAA